MVVFLIFLTQVLPIAKPLIADAATPKSSATALVDSCFNKMYIGTRGQTSSYGFHSKEVDELKNIQYSLQRFIENLYYHCDSNRGTVRGLAFAKQAKQRALALFDQKVAPTLYQAALKATANPKAATQNVKVWRMAVSAYAFIPSYVDSRDTSPANLRKAEEVLPAIINLHNANLRLQAEMYKAELAVYRKKANANGASVLDFALTSLQREMKARGKQTLLPTTNFAGAGDLSLPTTLFQPNPANLLPKNIHKNVDYDKRLNKALISYKYDVILPELAEEVYSVILDLRARGIRMEDSFNRLMAELGLDLLLGVTDVPTTNTRRVLAGIPESELRTAARTSSNPARAANIVDDIKKGTGSVDDGVRRGGNNPADDVDNTRGRNNPCVASGGSGFIAVATDSPTMEFSNGAIIADAGFLMAGRTCADIYNRAMENNLGKETVTSAINYLNQLDSLTVQTQKVTGGKSGNFAESFIGEPNSIYPTKAGNRILVTNQSGKVVLDISTQRIKVFYSYDTPNGIKDGDFKLPDFDSSGNALPTEQVPSQNVLDIIKKTNE
jgi:hypothetical protein